MSTRILYGHPVSSNTHRVRLLLSMLGVAFEERMVDLLAGAHLQPAFALLNPRRSVPVFDDGGTVLVESYAILIYLTRNYGGAQAATLWPDDPSRQADVASWMFYTANELHNGIGLARNERCFARPSGGEFTAARAARTLELIESHLQTHGWLAGAGATLADISAYPFIAVAGEAGLDLDAKPAIGAWLARLHELPGFIAMPLLKDMRA
jgi:glutathione S-transferase